jgi:DNA-binding MarR family transcriptional regulator
MDHLMHVTLFPFERAQKIIARRADTLLQKLVGCNRRELWVLVCISRGQLNQKQLSHRLDVHQNVTGRLLDELEKRSLLRRMRRLPDRREQVVELTEKGEEILKTFLKQQVNATLTAFAPLTESQIVQWRDLASAITRSEYPPQK